jgi:fructose-1,6-bisphosphatase/inositol monophosphatase family enzyme
MKCNDPQLAAEVKALVQDILSTIDLEPRDVHRRSDPVTNVDHLIDERLFEGLLRIVDCGYISEERNPVLPDNQRLAWVVDPIDGTHNLVAGLPEYGISVALMRVATREPQIAVCIMPDLGLDLVASKDGGAYCNGRRLSVGTQSTTRSLVAIELPAEAYQDVNRCQLLFRRLMGDGFTLRQSGSAMCDICRVATGSLYGFIEQGVKLWDVMASDLIATESGCHSWSAPAQESYAPEGALDYAVGFTADALKTLTRFMEKSRSVTMGKGDG